MDLKTQILAANKKLEPIDVPEWGFKVFVRRMTLDERRIWLQDRNDDGLVKNVTLSQALLLWLTVCDADGKRPFESAEELAQQCDAVVADRLSSAALKINGMNKEVAEEAKKNSENGASSGLSSVSLTSSECPVVVCATK